ncbi:dolichol-phosphate mannosyltransferase, partial [Micromonospora azadirachtae]
GARVVNWPLRRLALSRCGNLYARLALGMPVSDATGGYRVYRRGALDAMDLSSVCSQGYSFQVELSRLAHRAGMRIVEVPITFAEREHGSSKMNALIVAEALWRITTWAVQDRGRAWRRGTGRAS